VRVCLLGAGIDATILFESYHLNSVDERRLEKYRIGKLANPKESFYTWDSEFYPTLRSRVSDYFKENNLSHRSDIRMYLKTLLIMTAWCLTYYYGVVGTPSEMPMERVKDEVAVVRCAIRGVRCCM
jgi:hypothetical protein